MKKLFRNFRFLIEYFLILLPYLLMRISPHFTLRWFAACVSRGMFLLPSVRKLVTANVRTAFPEFTESKVRLVARKSLYNLVMNMLEFAWMTGVAKRIERWTFISDEVVKKLKSHTSKNERIIFVNPHLGSWEASAVIATHTCNIKMAAIAKVTRNPYLNNLLETIDLIEGAKAWHAESINLVVPYLGYSTMERAKKDSGEIPKGMTRTRRLLRQPLDYAAFVDLHAEGVMYAGHPSVDVEHYETDELVIAEIKSLTKKHPLTLVSPDYGRTKWGDKIAKGAGIPCTTADKKRFASDKVIVGQVSAAVKGRVALICDDMIRTAGTIGKASKRCREAGAVGVGFQATHLILAGEARQILRAADPIVVMGADTFPGVQSDELLTVYSVAGLIAEKLGKHFGF